MATSKLPLPPGRHVSLDMAAVAAALKDAVENKRQDCELLLLLPLVLKVGEEFKLHAKLDDCGVVNNVAKATNAAEWVIL